jgi:hypothetical protein
MGSALSATAGQVQPPSHYLTALPEHVLDQNLRTTRFLKVSCSLQSNLNLCYSCSNDVFEA